MGLMNTFEPTPKHNQNRESCDPKSHIPEQFDHPQPKINETPAPNPTKQLIISNKSHTKLLRQTAQENPRPDPEQKKQNFTWTAPLLDLSRQASPWQEDKKRSASVLAQPL